MAKKKKKKNVKPGLRDLYEVGEELTVKARIEDGVDEDGNPNMKMTKTPIRVTSVGYDCIGAEIVGNWGRRFIKGFEFKIENVPFMVISEQKTKAVLECLDENMLED